MTYLQYPLLSGSLLISFQNRVSSLNPIALRKSKTLKSFTCSCSECNRVKGLRSSHVYSSCVRSAMLHASETWPLQSPVSRVCSEMIRQICNVKPQDTATIRSTELLAWLGIEDLDLILKERRLHWLDIGKAATVQFRKPLTYRMMESVDLGGPG